MSQQILSNLAFQRVAFDGSQSAKAIPTGQLKWAGVTSVTCDISQSNQLLEFQSLQAIFVDNSQCGATLAISVTGTNVVLEVPAYAQGTFPLIAGDRQVLTLSCAAGAGYSQAWLLNFPISAATWGAIEATIANGNMSVLPNLTYSGNVLHPEVVANLIQRGALSASGSSGALVTGASGYYVAAIALQLTAGATLASAGELTATITDSSTGALWIADFWVPAAAANSAYVQIATPPGFFWNNKVANSSLSISLSAALTAGSLNYLINYGLSNFVA